MRNAQLQVLFRSETVSIGIVNGATIAVGDFYKVESSHFLYFIDVTSLINYENSTPTSATSPTYYDEDYATTQSHRNGEHA